jgi:hypothetical protein
MVAVNEELWRSVQQHQEDRELWESMSRDRVHGNDV